MNSFLQDGTGSQSSMRLITVLWATGIFLVWAIVSLWTKTLVDLPAGIQVALGAVLSGKVLQAGVETWGQTKQIPQEQPK